MKILLDVFYLNIFYFFYIHHLFYYMTFFWNYFLNGNENAIPDSEMFWVAMYGIFMVSVLIFILVGFIAAIMKIKQIKRFRAPKVWGEVSNGKKVSILLLSVPAVITVLMVIDVYGGFSASLIHDLIARGGA